MYNYEIWTIAVPENKPEIQEKFFELASDTSFSHLIAGVVRLELRQEEDLKDVLESYVMTACEKGEGYNKCIIMT